MIRHDNIAKGVVKVTYSNGISLIVNYTDTAVTEGKTTVAPRDFALVE